MTAPLNLSRLGLCLQTWASDVKEGFVEITRHGLALFGLLLVIVGGTFVTRPDLQSTASEALIAWLQIRQSDSLEAPTVMNAATRSTTYNPAHLTPDQAAVTHWLSRKYRVSAEPLGAMVAEAWRLGERSQLAPSLILAIMAIESRFNPFASGSQGNVGLMQLEIKAHTETLNQFGGPLSAFDPLTNVRVGVRHLQSLLLQTASLEEALALYGASSGQSMDSQYVGRVLAEQKLLDQVTEKQNSVAVAVKGTAPAL
jgi:soluble lytic murein transglycosylase-like protein